MTEKLYQQDSYLQEMEARVVKRGEREGRPALVLDRTVFYPTSGGQMHDTGRLNDVAVVDVQIAEEEIWHLLEQPLASEQLHGRIDWPRRFDFMQQHTGFHLLAGAFFQGFGIRTLAAHLGEEESTIEIDAPEVTTAMIEEVETLANRIIWEDRPVGSRLVSRAEAEKLQLRKAPQVEGEIRLIDIAGFDLDPCGGTHVSSTGQVGVVKIISRERIRQGTRCTFVAGGRAWRLIQNFSQIMDELTRLLTTDRGSLFTVVSKLQEENRSLRKTLQQKNQLLAKQALEALCTAAGEAPIISHIFTESDLELVRSLAANAVRKRAGIYLFAGASARAALVFAASAADRDLRPAFTAAMQIVEGRGGGEAAFLQGSGSRVDKIGEALRTARELLEKPDKKD
ncbi:MAG TPA: alanyl-tRNA editing protein [bacterium]|nr:alanyl-tRNA editing protein [bacterium]